MKKLSVLRRLLICLFVLIAACKKEIKEIKQSKVEFTKEGELTIYQKKDSAFYEVKTLDIEFAEDEYERQTGLMHRSSMKNNRGMLFIFEENRMQSFYMKNTLIPLDLLFINDQNKIVSFQKNAKPLNEQSLPSSAPAQYVLEINAGLAEEWNLSEGDSISFTKL